MNPPEPRTTAEDLQPLVKRAIAFLATKPRGASRSDLLSALNVQPSIWPMLRQAMEFTGEVVSVGRGPGLRHVYRGASSSPWPQPKATSPDFDLARRTIRELFQASRSIRSADAQQATGMTADQVRRLLLEFVHAGEATMTGRKRSTKYHWVDTNAA